MALTKTEEPDFERATEQNLTMADLSKAQAQA